jgi:uroporphyrinogen-III synthase
MVQKAPSLKGRTVAITRPAGQAEEAGELIRAKGGIPYYIPAIEIKGLSNLSAVEKFIAELQSGQVDYVILMSINGIKYLFEAAETLNQVDKLQQGLVKAFVIAVGPRTADALKDYHVRVDLVPTKYSSEGLIESLQRRAIHNKRIRIPRTSNAAPTLMQKLKKMGADVEEIYVYESGLPVDDELRQKFFDDLNHQRIDAIVFGSGLSAKNIFKMLSEKASMETLRHMINGKVTTVAIGPTTAQALKEVGIQVDVMPEDYLFEKALSALADYWSKEQL